VALARGVGLVPEDRKRHGLVLSMTARENLTLPLLPRLSRWGWVNRRAEAQLVADTFRTLRVRAASPEVAAASLSGGNQQKLVLARWLAARCRVLLLDEPTRGVDVGAKAEIHGLIDDLARSGSAVLLISSELPEVLNLATRVLVMREGRLVGELSREQARPEAVLRLMAGLPPP
jgi:ABC-type sugar transport system ATPase subunit